jgi:two-component system nitrate/nitrite response regulator NarL
MRVAPKLNPQPPRPARVGNRRLRRGHQKAILTIGSRQVAIHLVRNPARDPGVQLAQLTSREVQILQCVAQGKSNKNIARELALADATVKVHVKNLLRKISLRSRVEAAVWVLENKLFD